MLVKATTYYKGIKDMQIDATCFKSLIKKKDNKFLKKNHAYIIRNLETKLMDAQKNVYHK